MSRKTLFVTVTVLMFLVFGMLTLIYQNHKGSLGVSSGSDQQDLVERQGAPVKGPADARVTIVEFFDPACGTCADFYPLVKQLMDQYPGKVRVMMRYAPLHSGSGEVVKMLEAAHLQGKFWPALELLFKNQRRWVVNHVSQPIRARALLNGLALDHEKLDAAVNQTAVTRSVEEDVQDGQALNIRATPEFFVNGRPLPEFGYEPLSQMVKKAVATAY